MIPILRIVGAATAVFLPTLTFSLVNLDDQYLLEYFHHYADITQLPAAFRHGLWAPQHLPGGYYRPLVEVAWILMAASSRGMFGGPCLAWFHAWSVVVHACASVAVYGLLQELLPRRPAEAAALVFAVHPAAAAAVAWLGGI
ncbi:MAG TPA: hypothetical protein VFH51_18800, partial [Myxococcota bacterium]|nr:hypothetical protein [Myxococcota bacterium]